MNHIRKSLIALAVIVAALGCTPARLVTTCDNSVPPACTAS